MPTDSSSPHSSISSIHFCTPSKISLTKKRANLLSLPPEVLISCLLIPSRETSYGYSPPPVPTRNVLLICRQIYRLAAPVLYSKLSILANTPTEDPEGNAHSGYLQLLPLLTETQRSAFSLPPGQRMVDPSCVRELTIGSAYHESTTERLQLWDLLCMVLPEMKLRTINWLTYFEDDGVAQAIARSQMGNIEKIKCRVGGTLWHSELKGLTEIVAWVDGEFPYPPITSTRSTTTRMTASTWPLGLLQRSAGTLQRLHIGLAGHQIEGIAKLARGSLEGVGAMPKVRVLRLTEFDAESINAIERVVDFDSVEEFQIMHGAGLDVLKGRRLSHARRLIGNATTSGLLELLNACAGTHINKLFVELYDTEGNGAQLPPPPSMAIIEALCRKGAALTTLILSRGKYQTDPLYESVVLGPKEVERLVDSCPSLELLSIDVNIKDLLKIPMLLAKLPRLRHLKLVIIDNAPIDSSVTDNIGGFMAAYQLPKSTTPMSCLDGHWGHTGDYGAQNLPTSPVTPLEVALSHLIAAGVSGLQTVLLSFLNQPQNSWDAGLYYCSLTNCYQMGPRPAPLPWQWSWSCRGPGNWMYAPPGHRYAWPGGECFVVDRYKFARGALKFATSSEWNNLSEGSGHWF